MRIKAMGHKNSPSGGKNNVSIGLSATLFVHSLSAVFISIFISCRCFLSNVKVLRCWYNFFEVCCFNRCRTHQYRLMALLFIPSCLRVHTKNRFDLSADFVKLYRQAGMNSIASCLCFSRPAATVTSCVSRCRRRKPRSKSAMTRSVS